MSEKEQYRRKQQARLDEWKAELEKLKARARGASADARMELDREIERLEGKVRDAQGRLNELENASEEAWDSLRKGMDDAWESLKTSFSDAASKFRR